MAVSNMTRVEAVNIIIGTIGLSPINSLLGSLTSDITAAAGVLDEITRDTLAEGWHWNTEHDYPLSPNGSGEINWPVDAAQLSFSADNNPGAVVLVRRNGKLYDRKARSYVWDNTIKVTMLLYLEWDDIPQAARAFIAIAAARRYSNRMVGAGEINAYTMQDQLQARSAMMDDEANTANYNVFNTYDTARPLRRAMGETVFFNR